MFDSSDDSFWANRTDSIFNVSKANNRLLTLDEYMNTYLNVDEYPSCMNENIFKKPIPGGNVKYHIIRIVDDKNIVNVFDSRYNQKAFTFDGSDDLLIVKEMYPEGFTGIVQFYYYENPRRDYHVNHDATIIESEYRFIDGKLHCESGPSKLFFHPMSKSPLKFFTVALHYYLEGLHIDTCSLMVDKLDINLNIRPETIGAVKSEAYSEQLKKINIGKRVEKISNLLEYC